MHFVKPNPQLLLLEGRRGVFTLKPMTTHFPAGTTGHVPLVSLGCGVEGGSFGGRGWREVPRVGAGLEGGLPLGKVGGRSPVIQGEAPIPRVVLFPRS